MTYPKYSRRSVTRVIKVRSAQTWDPSSAARPDGNMTSVTAERHYKGTEVHYLGTGGSTDGQFGLYRWDMGPERSGPSSALSQDKSTFCILSGTVPQNHVRRSMQKRRLREISCTSHREECTHFAKMGCRRHPCSYFSHLGRHARHILKNWQTWPPVGRATQRRRIRSSLHRQHGSNTWYELRRRIK